MTHIGRYTLSVPWPFAYSTTCRKRSYHVTDVALAERHGPGALYRFALWAMTLSRNAMLLFFLLHAMDHLDVGDGARSVADSAGFIGRVDQSDCVAANTAPFMYHVLPVPSAPSWHDEHTAAVGVMFRSSSGSPAACIRTRIHSRRVSPDGAPQNAALRRRLPDARQLIRG